MRDRRNVRGVNRLVRTTSFGLLTLALVGCQFQSSITPIVWPTVPSQAFQPGVVSTGPAPSPVPIAPTPSPPPPTPIPFRGADDLDCEQPLGGDDHFGFCAIPGSDQYYVWGPCENECPAGKHPGIELKRVSDSSDLRDFIIIDSERDAMIERKADSGWWAGGFAAGDVVGGALAWEAAQCVVAGEITFGASCVAFVVGLGVGVVAAGKAIVDYIKADHELDKEGGLNESAQDKFQDMGSEPSSLKSNRAMVT